MLVGQANSNEYDTARNTRRREKREENEDDDDEEEEDKIDLRGRQDSFCMHLAMCGHYVCHYYNDYYSFLLPSFVFL